MSWFFGSYPGNDVGFHRRGLTPVAVPVAPGYGPESRAARVQGALLVDHMTRDVGESLFSDQSVWTAAMHKAVEVAFCGTETRPWRYETPGEAASGRGLEYGNDLASA